MKLLDLAFQYQKKFITSEKKRKIWVSSRQIGKSWSIAMILCFKALSKTNGLSLCISTGARAASEIISKCKQFAEATKVLTNGTIDYSSSFDSIKFSNGSRVLSLPSSTDGANLRGFTASCVCVDEAAYVWHLDTILQAINPTLSRDKDAELILTTTPAGKNGPFYKLYEEACESDDWYVQHTTIHDAIADGLDVNLESLKTLCPDIDVFAQEYECKFSSEFGSLVDTSLLDFYDEPPKDIDSTYLGGDIGIKNDRSSFVTVNAIGDTLYVDDIAMLSKTSYEDQLEIVKQLNSKHTYKAGFLDETGIGSAFAEFVTKKVSSLIKGYTWTGANKTPAYEDLRAKIFQHKVKFNSKFKPLIIEDFNNVQRIVNEAGTVKYAAGRDQNGHSDCASAIVLALQAANQHPASFQTISPAIPFQSVFLGDMSTTF